MDACLELSDEKDSDIYLSPESENGDGCHEAVEHTIPANCFSVRQPDCPSGHASGAHGVAPLLFYGSRKPSRALSRSTSHEIPHILSTATSHEPSHIIVGKHKRQFGSGGQDAGAGEDDGDISSWSSSVVPAIQSPRSLITPETKLRHGRPSKKRAHESSALSTEPLRRSSRVTRSDGAHGQGHTVIQTGPTRQKRVLIAKETTVPRPATRHPKQLAERISSTDIKTRKTSKKQELKTRDSASTRSAITSVKLEYDVPLDRRRSSRLVTKAREHRPSNLADVKPSAVVSAENTKQCKKASISHQRTAPKEISSKCRPYRRPRTVAQPTRASERLSSMTRNVFSSHNLPVGKSLKRSRSSEKDGSRGPSARSARRAKRARTSTSAKSPHMVPTSTMPVVEILDSSKASSAPGHASTREPTSGVESDSDLSSLSTSDDDGNLPTSMTTEYLHGGSEIPPARSSIEELDQPRSLTESPYGTSAKSSLAPATPNQPDSFVDEEVADPPPSSPPSSPSSCRLFFPSLAGTLTDDGMSDVVASCPSMSPVGDEFSSGPAFVGQVASESEPMDVSMDDSSVWADNSESDEGISLAGMSMLSLEDVSSPANRLVGHLLEDSDSNMDMPMDDSSNWADDETDGELSCPDFSSSPSRDAVASSSACGDSETHTPTPDDIDIPLSSSCQRVRPRLEAPDFTTALHHDVHTMNTEDPDSDGTTWSSDNAFIESHLSFPSTVADLSGTDSEMRSSASEDNTDFERTQESLAEERYWPQLALRRKRRKRPQLFIPRRKTRAAHDADVEELAENAFERDYMGSDDLPCGPGQQYMPIPPSCDDHALICADFASENCGPSGALNQPPSGRQQVPEPVHSSIVPAGMAEPVVLSTPPRSPLLCPSPLSDLRLEGDAQGACPHSAQNHYTYTAVRRSNKEHDRPPFPGKMRPPIWSESRQAICTTLTHFRSFQRGVQFRDGVAFGYLLSSYGASRDIWANDGYQIVSHGGGKNEITTRSAEDQTAEDASVTALRETHKQRTPILLLADNRYPLFPFDMSKENEDCKYLVLGFYVITGAWAEREGTEGVTRWKFLFQWANGQGDPWWLSEELAHKHRWFAVSPSYDIRKRCVRQCTECSTISPQVYRELWTCLNEDCASFWRRDESTPMPDVLSYAPCFVLPEAVPPVPSDVLRGVTLLRAKVSVPPTRDPDDDDDPVQSLMCGIHCEACGFVSARVRWEHWECLNCGTLFDGAPPKRGASPDLLKIPDQWTKYDPFYRIKDADVKMTVKAYGQHVVHSFQLPIPKRNGVAVRWEGRAVVHVISTTSMNDPVVDSLFERYQDQANKGDFLTRHPLKYSPIGPHAGDFFPNYFSHNAGSSYNYVAATGTTVSFAHAPRVVQDALALINARCALALGPADGERFNQLMTVGYLDACGMKFHDDGETGVGPVVATLSLGAPALMRFAHKETPAEAAARKRRGRGRHARLRPVLNVVLTHGTVVVMEGLAVQRHYKHAVETAGFRIAPTARTIGVANRAGGRR